MAITDVKLSEELPFKPKTDGAPYFLIVFKNIEGEGMEVEADLTVEMDGFTTDDKYNMLRSALWQIAQQL